MVRIQVDIPSEKRSVEVDISDRSTVKDVIAPLRTQELLYDLGAGGSSGRVEWTLRIKRRSEQGRWWTEQEILDYTDREPDIGGRLGMC